MTYAPDAVYEQGWRDALVTAVQRVEALCISPHEWDYTPRKSLGEIKHEAWQEAIAAIKADQR